MEELDDVTVSVLNGMFRCCCMLHNIDVYYHLTELLIMDDDTDLRNKMYFSYFAISKLLVTIFLFRFILR
jgi:hypothetical protein